MYSSHEVYPVEFTDNPYKAGMCVHHTKNYHIVISIVCIRMCVCTCVRVCTCVCTCVRKCVCTRMCAHVCKKEGGLCV